MTSYSSYLWYWFFPTIKPEDIPKIDDKSDKSDKSDKLVTESPIVSDPLSVPVTNVSSTQSSSPLDNETLSTFVKIEFVGKKLDEGCVKPALGRNNPMMTSHLPKCLIAITCDQLKLKISGLKHVDVNSGDRSFSKSNLEIALDKEINKRRNTT